MFEFLKSAKRKQQEAYRARWNLFKARYDTLARSSRVRDSWPETEVELESRLNTATADAIKAWNLELFWVLHADPGCTVAARIVAKQRNGNLGIPTEITIKSALVESVLEFARDVDVSLIDTPAGERLFLAPFALMNSDRLVEKLKRLEQASYSRNAEREISELLSDPRT